MDPRVTFIIAHHNYQEYLANAIESALNQTYANIHLCVIDDCSDDINSVIDIINQHDEPIGLATENSSMLIREGRNITSIFLTDRPHGPSYTRNRGIEYMWDETDIFAILDADDENYCDKIQKCVNIIKENPQEIGIVYADHYTLNTVTNTGTYEYREPFDVYRLNQECIIHSGSVITKYALEHVKEDGQYYDELMRTCEDYDLWMRICEKFIAVHIAEPLSLVRVQPKNSTDTVSKQIWNFNYNRVFEKKKARYEKTSR